MIYVKINTLTTESSVKLYALYKCIKSPGKGLIARRCIERAAEGSPPGCQDRNAAQSSDQKSPSARNLWHQAAAAAAAAAL